MWVQHDDNNRVSDIGQNGNVGQSGLLVDNPVHNVLVTGGELGKNVSNSRRASHDGGEKPELSTVN